MIPRRSRALVLVSFTLISCALLFTTVKSENAVSIAQIEHEIIQQLAALTLKDGDVTQTPPPDQTQPPIQPEGYVPPAGYVPPISPSGYIPPVNGYIPPMPPTTGYAPCPVQDITFSIADLKFNPATGSLKLLECGDGARSKYMGYDRLFGVGAMWTHFWNYLQQFGLPTWCVRMPGDPLSRNTMAPQLFFGMGGKNSSGVADLGRRILSTLFEQHQNVTLQDCLNYQGLVLVRWGRAEQTMARFKSIFPNVRFIGDPINNLIRNKYYTNQLFIDTGMEAFRPKCKICPQVYSPELAGQIINELQSNIIVIKPPNASRGRGVIFVHQEDLDAVLRLILLNPDQIEDRDPDSSYGYWTTDESMGNTIFLAEEYAESKHILVDGKIFDPTLRLVFALHKDQTGSHVTFFGGYWKLPAKALTDEGSLTEKHKSDISASYVSSALVTPEDLQVSSEMLRPVLATLYEYMLTHRNSQTRSPFVFSADDGQDSY
jgi:hypothetical protein